MAQIKYYLAILGSLLSLLLPIGGVYLFYTNQSTPFLIMGLIIACIGLLLNKTMQNLRIKYRQNVEYDEFGRSKSKGAYERLSKKERDAIDLQKTLDMERIVDSSAIKKITKKGSKTPLEDLNGLIGLEPVKEKVKEMVARMEFEQEELSKMSRKEKREAKNNLSMSGRHMVFYGSPGTGKTTVARILTGFLNKYGYISENKCIEIDGNFLKAGIDTATKTELIVREAFGGVLFIDEAYSLMDGGFGMDAIATLLKQMEDNRDKFILIMAGYTNEMKDLLRSNPGFESRVKEYLDFPDYSNEEMFEIAKLMAKEQKFKIGSDCLYPLYERFDNEKKLKSFGNARTVRNIIDEAIDRHTLNLSRKTISPEDRYILREPDINVNIRKNTIW